MLCASWHWDTAEDYNSRLPSSRNSTPMRSTQVFTNTWQRWFTSTPLSDWCLTQFACDRIRNIVCPWILFNLWSIQSLCTLQPLNTGQQQWQEDYPLWYKPEDQPAYPGIALPKLAASCINNLPTSAWVTGLVGLIRWLLQFCLQIGSMVN